MPNGTQLSAEDFAAKIKAKYPDYAHIPDQELTTKILDKYPEYREKVMAPGVSQARKAIAAGAPKIDTFDSGQRSYTSMSPTGIATSPMIPAKTQAEVIGAGVGGTELGAAAKGLPWLIRLLAGASGAGAGAGAGDVATGGTPKEALGTAAKTTGAAAAIEGAGMVASPFLRWLTSSKSTGAKLLQMAESKAGEMPVELSPKTNDLVAKIMEQEKSGGKPVKLVKDLLERVGPNPQLSPEAKPGPLTYREARNFYSNATDLSAEEKASFNNRTKALIKQFTNSFGEDIQKTADTAKVGKQHAAGMKEYAMASSRNRALAKAGKAVPYVAGGVAGYDLLRQLIKQMHP